MRLPAQFSQISCQILAEKFFQSNKNFPTIFPKHQSNFLSNFNREIFPVKQKFSTNFFQHTHQISQPFDTSSDLSSENFPTIFFSTPTKFPNPLAHFLIFYHHFSVFLSNRKNIIESNLKLNVT